MARTLKLRALWSSSAPFARIHVPHQLGSSQDVGNGWAGADGVLNTWVRGLWPVGSGAAEVVVVFGDTGIETVPPGHPLPAGMVDVVLLAVLVDMVVPALRLEMVLEYQLEMFANCVKHPGLTRQSYSAHDHRTPGYVVVEVETLTWAETDTACLEQDQTPLWPNPGQEKTWPGLIYAGVRRVVCLKCRDSILRIA